MNKNLELNSVVQLLTLERHMAVRLIGRKDFESIYI